MHAGFSYADPNAGVHGAFAILAALYHRKKTGEGQYIDMSQWECAMGLLPEGIMEYTMNGREPARDGNRDPLIAPHGVFPSKDRFENTGIMIDMWVSIVAADDAEFGRLASAIGKPEMARDPVHCGLDGDVGRALAEAAHRLLRRFVRQHRYRLVFDAADPVRPDDGRDRLAQLQRRTAGIRTDIVERAHAHGLDSAIGVERDTHVEQAVRPVRIAPAHVLQPVLDEAHRMA